MPAGPRYYGTPGPARPELAATVGPSARRPGRGQSLMLLLRPPLLSHCHGAAAGAERLSYAAGPNNTSVTVPSESLYGNAGVTGQEPDTPLGGRARLTVQQPHRRGPGPGSQDSAGPQSMPGGRVPGPSQTVCQSLTRMQVRQPLLSHAAGPGGPNESLCCRAERYSHAAFDSWTMLRLGSAGFAASELSLPLPYSSTARRLTRSPARHWQVVTSPPTDRSPLPYS